MDPRVSASTGAKHVGSSPTWRILLAPSTRGGVGGEVTGKGKASAGRVRRATIFLWSVRLTLKVINTVARQGFGATLCDLSRFCATLS